MTLCSTFHLVPQRAAQVISKATPQSGTTTSLQFYIKSQKCFGFGRRRRARKQIFALGIIFCFNTLPVLPWNAMIIIYALALGWNGRGVHYARRRRRPRMKRNVIHISLLPFSYVCCCCCCCRAPTLVTAFSYFSHLSFALHLVKNEVFAHLFLFFSLHFNTELQRLCSFGGRMDFSIFTVGVRH